MTPTGPDPGTPERTIPGAHPSGLDDFGHGGPPDSGPIGPGSHSGMAHPSGGGAQSGGASGVGATASGASEPPPHTETAPEIRATTDRPGTGPAPAAAEPLELSMLGTAGPVLLRRFGPALLTGLVTAAVVWRRLRR